MLTINIAKHFPNAMVYGIDRGEIAIAKAKENKKKENISNVEFDWIVMIDLLHDLPNPDPCFVFSTFCCLPCSMSTEPAVGRGVGWGMEN
jgi:precorrin-6B methylase 2